MTIASFQWHDKVLLLIIMFFESIMCKYKILFKIKPIKVADVGDFLYLYFLLFFQVITSGKLMCTFKGQPGYSKNTIITPYIYLLIVHIYGSTAAWQISVVLTTWMM